MDEFAEFNPHLTGSVLKGDAGKYASIHLHLFTDNGKTVEHHLLNQDIKFKSDEVRLYRGDRVFNAPVLTFERNNVAIQMTLLSMRDLRTQLKASPEGKPIERAKRATVETLIAAD
jgi:hypothetical protein